MKSRLKGFTLVELLVAAAVMAVGLVFLLGALGRCSTSLTLARRTVTASVLLNNKLWELDAAHKASNGAVEGEEEGAFEEPNGIFRWKEVLTPLTANLTGGPQNASASDLFLEETVSVSWLQGRTARNVSVTRYVQRANVTGGG